MAELDAAFAEWLAGQGRAANTVAAYRRDVAAYLQWRATAVPSDNPLAAYVDELRATRKPTSAARAVVALRIFHRWRDDSTPDAPPLPELRGLPRTPSADEPDVDERAVARLLAATRGDTAERRRDAVAIGLLYFGGLKASEAISLDSVDVTGDAAALTIDRDGPHERLLPVVPALHESLSRWLHPMGRDRLHPSTGAVLVNRRGQRLTRQGLWLLTGAASKRARLDDALSPNDLRRGCAAHLAGKGVSPAAIGAFLGHTRLPTTERGNPQRRRLGEL